MKWNLYYGTTIDDLGMLPAYLSEGNDDKAAVQLDFHYKHGGGWSPFSGFKLQLGQDNRPVLVYPGDPPLLCRAATKLRDEIITLFESDWVCVVQPDGKFEVSRMD